MTRSSANTKERILTTAYELLYKEGFARVSMDAIAEASNVTKRTLYYHYDSKDELVAAVLDYQHQFAITQIQKWASKSAKNLTEYLEGIFEEIEDWASRPRWLGSGFTRLTIELAHLPGHPARLAAHRHKAAVEEWLVTELKKYSADEPKLLAKQITILIEGCVVKVLIHNDISYVKAALDVAKKLTCYNTKSN